MAYIKFEPADEVALQRLTEAVTAIGEAKTAEALDDEARWASLFSQTERSRFVDLTPEEMAEWNDFWFSTPLPQRHGPDMPMPGWDLGSMIDAIANGEYEIIGVRRTDHNHALLEIAEHGWPFGGLGALRALVEGFGHRVVALDDGSGELSAPEQRIWLPKGRRA